MIRAWIVAYNQQHMATYIMNKEIDKVRNSLLNPKKIFTSVNNWCVQLTWKLIEAISSKIWLELKKMKINDVFLLFYVYSKLKFLLHIAAE